MNRDALARELVLTPDFVARHPFFGSLLASLEIVADPFVHVMAVSRHGDRFRLHVNVEYLSECREFVRGVLLHELLHLSLGHLEPDRFGPIDHPYLFEIACEMSANEFVGERLPGRPILLWDYLDVGIRPGQSTLERYHLLVRAAEAGRDFPTRRSCVRQGQAPGLYDLLRRGRSSLRPPAGRGRQAVEARATRDRPLDWQRILAHLARRPRRVRVPCYAWPNRRFPRWIGVIPGRRYRSEGPARPTVLVAIDTSGSMTREELDRVAYELTQLHALARIYVAECDSQIQRVYRFDGKLREVRGRGGTDLRPIFERRAHARYGAAGVVYFTDGDGPYPDPDPKVKTVWVLTKPETFRCPWGLKVRL